MHDRECVCQDKCVDFDLAFLVASAPQWSTPHNTKSTYNYEYRTSKPICSTKRIISECNVSCLINVNGLIIFKLSFNSAITF